MKTLFIILLAIVVFYCLNSRVINENPLVYDTEERDNFISKLVEKEFLTGVKNDEIFLNLAFGMSEKEAREKFKTLENIKILQNISSANGIIKADYSLTYQDYLNSGKIFLFFVEDRLSEMQIDTTGYNKGRLRALFVQKYGDFDYTASFNGNDEYHWISGNRHIAFIEQNSNKNILIQFIDTTSRMNEKNKALIKYAGLEGKFNG